MREERFWSKVDRSAGEAACWPWKAARSGVGYGIFFDGKLKGAHRVAYEMVKGPIPPGLDVDHLCRNRACVNPAHLEPVTRGENVRRGDAASVNRAHCAAVTHCPKGHAYTPENTRVGARRCRACRACERARAAQRRAAT